MASRLCILAAVLICVPTTVRANPLSAAKSAWGKLTTGLKPQQRPIPMNFSPTPRDWSFVSTVKSFQSQVPGHVKQRLASATPRQLADAFSVSYTQKVDDGRGAGPKTAAVEITQGLVNLPLARFLEKMPADQWGTHLDHYLGGAVKVTERSADGKPVRQVERMVLSGLPGDLNLRALNMDMTKVEQREERRDAAGNLTGVTMYWRVHSSENKTTAMDVGSVAFEAYGQGQTRVTFHSAHRLGMDKLIFPAALVKPTLRSFFSDHVRHYRELVTQ